jgi:serine/threonine-protein kinase
VEHPPGSRIADRYVVESRLGAGGMGVVLRARDERLDRVVALKVLSASAIGDAQATSRLIREAKATAALEHPHIVPIYDVGPTGDGGAYLAIQLVKGETLRSKLKREGTLSLSETRRIVAEVGSALHFAHEAGIVHRDVKPDNIMLRQDDGRAVVLDFGLAKRLDADHGDMHTLTAEGSIVGTPAYLSPEQARGLEIDGRTDQFALAVIAYELLTGRIPWRGTTLTALLASVMTDEAPRLSTVPASVADAIDRALSKAPDARFVTVREFVDAITSESVTPESGAALLDGPSHDPEAFAQTMASGDPIETAAPSPRRRGRLWLGAAALLAAVGVGAWVMSSLRTPPEPPDANVSDDAGDDAAVTLATLPDPTGCSEDATSAYRRGLRLLHTGNWGEGCAAFRDAASLDDTCASAHLRIANCALGTNDDQGGREGFIDARLYEEKLTERELAILHALEPLYASASPDRPAYAERLSALPERFPNDAELLVFAAMQSDSPRSQRLEWVRRSVELDPACSDCYQILAQLLAVAGESDEAANVLARCRTAVPQSSDCALEQVVLSRARGQCQQALDRVGDFRALAPTQDAAGLATQAKLEAAVGMPETAIRGTIDAIEGDAETRSFLLTRLLAHVGKLDELAAAPGERTDLPFVDAAVIIQAMVELGRMDEALRLAVETAQRRRAQLGTLRMDPYLLHLELAILEAAHPGLGDETYDSMLDRIVSTQPVEGYVGAEDRWAAFSCDVESPEAAQETLDALGTEPPLFGEPPTLACAGRALTMAGRPAEAIPRLEHLARGCEVLDYPFLTTHALIWLGEAHDAAGDHEAACAAYRDVIARWGDNAPTARTVRDARQRLRECG